MNRIMLITLLMVATTTTLAQNPIPRQGEYCPTGTYKSGDYCKPIKSNSDQVIIEKSNLVASAPLGFINLVTTVSA
jgi:hypothetical protein